MVSKKQAEADALKAKLIEGWEWMMRNPSHSRLNDFYNGKWMPVLMEFRQKAMEVDRSIPRSRMKFADHFREQLALSGMMDTPEGPKERLQS